MTLVNVWDSTQELSLIVEDYKTDTVKFSILDKTRIKKTLSKSLLFYRVEHGVIYTPVTIPISMANIPAKDIHSVVATNSRYALVEMNVKTAAGLVKEMLASVVSMRHFGKYLFSHYNNLSPSHLKTYVLKCAETIVEDEDDVTDYVNPETPRPNNYYATVNVNDIVIDGMKMKSYLNELAHAEMILSYLPIMDNGTKRYLLHFKSIVPLCLARVLISEWKPSYSDVINGKC